MNYNNLRRLLKEGVLLKDSWTDKDEQNFVSALDHDLEKVYTFQTNNMTVERDVDDCRPKPRLRQV